MRPPLLLLTRSPPRRSQFRSMKVATAAGDRSKRSGSTAQLYAMLDTAIAENPAPPPAKTKAATTAHK